MVFQILRRLPRVIAVPFHTKMQRLQTDIQKERILRSLDRTQVAHQLCGSLRDIGSFPELLRIDNSVISLIRRRKPRILIGMRLPVKITAVHDGAAHAGRMSIHILCRGMGHDIRTPLKRPAVHRRRKGIVHNKRNAMCMRRLREFLKIQHYQRRIGNTLAEYSLRIRAEGF